MSASTCTKPHRPPCHALGRAQASARSSRNTGCLWTVGITDIPPMTTPLGQMAWNQGVVVMVSRRWAATMPACLSARSGRHPPSRTASNSSGTPHDPQRCVSLHHLCATRRCTIPYVSIFSRRARNDDPCDRGFMPYIAR